MPNHLPINVSGSLLGSCAMLPLGGFSRDDSGRLVESMKCKRMRPHSMDRFR